MDSLPCVVILGRAYRKRFNPKASSHCRNYTLICCADILTPGCTGVWPTPKGLQSSSLRIHTSLIIVAITLLQGVWLIFSEWPPPPQSLIHHLIQQRAKIVIISGGKPRGNFFLICCIMETPLWCLCHVGFCVSVHDTNSVNTVGPFLTEVTYKKVSLLFHGLWCL